MSGGKTLYNLASARLPHFQFLPMGTPVWNEMKTGEKGCGINI